MLGDILKIIGVDTSPYVSKDKKLQKECEEMLRKQPIKGYYLPQLINKPTNKEGK